MRHRSGLLFASLLLTGGALAQSDRLREQAIDGFVASGLIEPGWAPNMRSSSTLDGDALVSLAELRSQIVIPQAAWNFYKNALRKDRKGDQVAAASLAEEAVRLAPDFVQARVALAVAYLRNDNFEAAAEQIHAALNLDPSYLPGRELLGIATFLQGEFTAAVEILQGVLKNGPERPETHYFLARALCEIDQCTRANEHFKTAQRLRRHPAKRLSDFSDWVPITEQ
jgi:predicted Zn-dependent protease